MKTFLLFACLYLFAASSTAQQNIRFGKRQSYISMRGEKETPLDKTIATAYSRIYTDTLEVPLNRCFSNDTMMVFVGVPFRYSFAQLYQALLATGKNAWSEFDKERKYFYLQNEYNKLVVNRYAYYSNTDKLFYLVNYVFASNQKISIKDFKQVVSTSIKKK